MKHMYYARFNIEYTWNSTYTHNLMLKLICCAAATPKRQRIINVYHINR